MFTSGEISMSDAAKNPFTPLEMWDDTMVTINEGDEKKKVDAKRYTIRYLVGESEDKRYVDGGDDDDQKSGIDAESM